MSLVTILGVVLLKHRGTVVIARAAATQYNHIHVVGAPLCRASVVGVSGV